MSDRPETLPKAVAPPQGPGAVTSHLLAYGGLLTSLLQSCQRTLGQRALGAVLSLCGLAVCTLLLTLGAVAAAWPTDNRWPVLLAVAGFYLATGVVGLWLLLRPAAVPAPTSVLLNELRQDIELLSNAWQERKRER